MKIKKVAHNNRSKTLTIEYFSGKTVTCAYGNLGIEGPLEESWVDKETRGRSVGIRLKNGTEEYFPYDQPLSLTRDPEYLLRNHIEHLIAKIKETMARKKITKRYLARELKTSDNQVHRLLNPSILNKNLGQLYKMAHLLGLELEWRLKEAA